MRRFLDLLLYLTLCFLAGTGLLLEWRLPPGRQGGHGLTVLGLDRHEWGEIHLWTAYLFLALIALHLWLARKWLLKIATRKKPALLLIGLTVGAVILLGLLFLPVRHG